MKQTKDKIQVGTLLTAEIYRQAKAQAAIEHRTIGDLIDEAIRLYLDSKKKEIQDMEKRHEPKP